MRSALRASGASVVLVPASSALAVAAAAAAAAVEESGGGDGDNNNQNKTKTSSVILLGLAAAVAAEGLSAVPWPRSAFDDTKASAALQPCAGGWESARAVEKAKYLSLGAAGELFFPFLSLFHPFLFSEINDNKTPTKERKNEAGREDEAEKEGEKKTKEFFQSFFFSFFFKRKNPQR